MNTDDNRIIELNQTFYKKVEIEFLKSGHLRRGWKRVGEYIKNNFNNPDILDLGCGNGKFLKYLRQTYPNYNLTYTGMDTNKYLLKQAQKKCPQGTYINNDIFRNLHSIRDKFDIIAGFGVTHHLPSLEFGKNWVNQILELLTEDGVLILSFWVFGDSLGKHIMGWGNRKGVTRVCTRFSENEIIGGMFSKTVFESKFEEKPSQRGNRNIYYILKPRQSSK